MEFPQNTQAYNSLSTDEYLYTEKGSERDERSGISVNKAGDVINFFCVMKCIS